ncbi:MAG: type II toxin-antitoxin system RelE/ParE family toxin [Actinomycetota bacterium]|nr:type II toxin-antitoxin system RelE/ParE family toxin [Actinomycetota bacterium]
MEVRWSSRASRDMDRLAVDAPRVAAAVAESVYGALVQEPHRVGKPLRDELVGMYSARRAEYRIVYKIDEAKDEVMIIRVGARRTIYRPT